MKKALLLCFIVLASLSVSASASKVSMPAGTNATAHAPGSSEKLPFPDVWVDDDFTHSTPGWGVTHFDNIQDAYGAVAEGGTIHVSSGEYTESIYVNKTLSILGEGRETTILNAGSSHYVFYPLKRIVVKGFTLQGADTFPGSVAAIWLLNDAHNSVIADNIFRDSQTGLRISSSGNEIYGNTFTENLYDGVATWTLANNNSIHHNYFLNNDRYGYFLVGGDNNDISHNVFVGDGINAELNNYVISFHNNTVNGKPFYYLFNETGKTVSGAGQVIVLFSKDIKILNSDFSNIYRGLLIKGSDDVEVSGSQFKGNREFGTDVSYSDRILFRNNVFSGNKIGVRLRDSYYNTIIDNVFENNGQYDYGLLAEFECSHNLIEGNMFTGNNDALWYDGVNNTIRENYFESNNVGIEFHGEDSFIHSNWIRGSATGIFVMYASGNEIYGNLVEDGMTGIGLTTYADENLIFGNTVQNNSNYGIYLTSSKNNTVWRNNLFSNAENGKDYSYFQYNTWFSEGEGNHWSDYDSEEEGCFDLDQNGFCDDPYSIPPYGNEDAYPSVKPY